MKIEWKSFLLSEKQQQALADADWQRNVLVGCLRERQQLRACRRFGFYHIPADRLENGDSVKWVAIYQSQNLFGSRSGIRYYGRVVNCRLVPRSEITEIPRDSDTLYYRFDVTAWRRLPRKIISKEMPFTHMLTTEFLLQNSRQVPELFLENEQEYRLFQGLRRLLARRRVRTVGFAFGDGAVVLKRGEVFVQRGEALRPTFLRQDFLEFPYTVLKGIQSELDDSPINTP